LHLHLRLRNRLLRVSWLTRNHRGLHRTRRLGQNAIAGRYNCKDDHSKTPDSPTVAFHDHHATEKRADSRSTLLARYGGMLRVRKAFL
jgi:hypothetical protein